MALARQRRAPGRPARLRVLQQHPLDTQQLHVGDRPPVLGHADLDEQPVAAAVAPDADGVAGVAVAVDLDPRLVAELAQPAEQAVALERELDPVLGVVAEQLGPAADHRVGRGPVEIRVVEHQLARLATGELGGIDDLGEVTVTLERDALGRRQLGIHWAAEAGDHPPRAVAPGVVAVTAGEQPHDRLDPARVQLGEHEPVAGEHAGLGDVPVAERVVGGRVTAAVVEDQARAVAVEDLGQALAQGPEVVVVADALAEGDRRRADRLGRAPVGVVDREGPDRGIVGEQGPGPVAVMEVEIDDRDRIDEAAAAQLGDRHGDVVDQAEALAAVVLGVVKAPAEIDGELVAAQRSSGREQGPAGHDPLEIDDPLGEA